VERAKEGNIILDVEPWDKLCEYGIDSAVLSYKVVRLRREGKMLRLSESDVKVMSPRKKRLVTHIDLLGIRQKTVRVLEN